MEGQYWLRRAVLGPQAPLSISEERYNLLRNARSTLVDAGAFEQKYEILLGNYIELEKFCTEWSLRREIEADHRYEIWAKVLLDANRYIMNLLSAGRSYTDHVVRDFKHLSLVPTFQEQANNFMREAYDRSASYRFVCALRNYVQHRAAAVHGITSGTKSECWADRMIIYCIKEKLREDGDFKATVLAEAESKTDLRKTFRGYMREVSEIHIGLRRLVAEACLQARTVHQDAIVDFVAAQGSGENGRPELGLSICRKLEETFVDVHPVLLEWDDARVILSEKNRYALKM